MTRKKETLRLEDCLMAFTSPEDLSGDDRYLCETCKRKNNSRKKIAITRLPEILTVHLKRFLYDSAGRKISDPVAFPMEGLDMSPFLHPSAAASRGVAHPLQPSAEVSVPPTAMYSLTAVILHHGMFGSGHYTAYVKHDKQWHYCDDNRVYAVTEENVRRETSDAYVLFYHRDDVAKKVRKRVLKELQKRSSGSIPRGSGLPTLETRLISRRWLSLWEHHSFPGPIDDFDFLCQHRAVHPRRLAVAEDLVVRVPLNVYTMLQRMYGGGCSVESLTLCRVCEGEMEALEARRQRERKLVTEADRKTLHHGERWYLLCATWLSQWRAFALEGGDEVPGPISNHVLVDKEGVPRKGLMKAKHYRGVAQEVWRILQGQYGGGPCIIRHVLDIYGDPIDPEPGDMDGPKSV
eukprot:Rmarinus@m.29678